MQRKKPIPKEEPKGIYTDEDYDLAQARLDKIEERFRSGAETDALLYKTLESIVLSPEPKEMKEGMVICFLERFFFRVRMGVRH